jgi:hypothetical protein
MMAAMVDRTEFRRVLKEIVKCMRQNLDPPGISPLGAEQIMFWMKAVTEQDLEAVTRELDAEDQSSR